jgi:hypothetical protein
MPLNSFPVSGKVYASDSSTSFPDVNVSLKNVTNNEEKTFITNSNGEFVFDLSDFNLGYSSGNTLKLKARLGSLYKEADLTVSGEYLTQNLTLGLDTDYMDFDMNLIKEELISFIRNSLEDPNSRGTQKTDVFIADGSTVKFELSESTAKNITFVMSGSSILSRYSNYYADYKDKYTLNKPVVYFITPPSNGTQVEIRYIYCTSSWVYPDVPQIDLNLDDYPRISIDINGMDISESTFNGLGNIIQGSFTASIYAQRKNQLDDLVTKLKELMLSNKKSFHYIDFVTLTSIGPSIGSPERGDKIIQRDMEFSFILKEES